MEEQWQKDVQNTINKARSQVTVDPDAAETMIQNKTNDLTAVTELRPEMRDRLMGMLRAASREIKRRKEEFTHREQQRIREEMARREMEMTNAALEQDQNKVKQLMERFDSLMAEGRHRLAEESAASRPRRSSTAPCRRRDRPCVAATHDARFLGAYDDIMAVRVAKQKGFVDAMFQTEKSQSPPPTTRRSSIRTPKSGRSSRRVAGKSTAPRNSRAAARPRRRSKRPSSSRRRSNSWRRRLKDVVDYLKDLHHIEIQLDVRGLEGGGRR